MAGAEYDTPEAFIERTAGFSRNAACDSAPEFLGLSVRVAGGANLVADIIPGTLGTVHVE